MSPSLLTSLTDPQPLEAESQQFGLKTKDLN